ncbi:hypothetical protein KY289_001245 [Solanum tuberosum]|nr:hypothetical protein KY289_001245 [Solanum tuberosum]
MDYKRKKHFYKNNKSNVCHKCGRIGHYVRDCKVKDKIKSLDLEDNIRDSLYKILLNSSLENFSPKNSDEEKSSTSEDLKVLHEEDYMSSSEEECTSCQISKSCDNKDKDKSYQLYSQFKDLYINVINSQFKDLYINVISNDNWVEMLRMIDDPTLRSQIIDKIANISTSTSNTKIPKEKPAHNDAYTMAEVKRQLKLQTQRDHIPTTIQDLVEEINNLKKEISSLKNHIMILDERIIYIENKDNNHHAKQVIFLILLMNFSSWSGSSEGGEFPNLHEPKEKRVQSTKGSVYQSGSVPRRPQRKRQGGRRGHYGKSY